MTKIEKTAIIEEPCEIGEDVFIGHNVQLRPGCKIGDRTKIGPFAFLEGDNIIGSDVYLAPHCHITKGMIIEDKVFIGPSITSMNDKEMVHNRRHVREFKMNPPILKWGCRVGGGVVLLPGVVVGENAVVGAGSIVTKNVKAGTVVYGSPARYIMDVPGEMII